MANSVFTIDGFELNYWNLQHVLFLDADIDGNKELKSISNKNKSLKYCH